MAERDEGLTSNLPAFKIARRALTQHTLLKSAKDVTAFSGHCPVLLWLSGGKHLEKQHSEKPLLYALLLCQNAQLPAQLPP